MSRITPFQNNYPELYPGHSPVRIKEIRPNRMYLIISFTSDDPILYETKLVRVKIDDCVNEPLKIPVTTMFKGFDKVAEKHHITIQVTPPAHYKQAGLTSPGWITVTDTDIPFDYGTRVMDWLYDVSDDHKKEIAKLIGDEVDGLNEGYDIGCVILERLMDDLRDHMGTPNDTLNRSNPLDQYKMAINGESRVQCNNIVDIFTYFCASYYVPARRINLWQGGLFNSDIVKSFGYNLQTAGGHTVAEVYDEGKNQWIMMDPMYGIEAFKVDADCHYLNVAELQTFINNPDFLNTIEITKYVGDDHFEFNRKFKEESFFGTYRNYLNYSQRIGYVMP